MAEIGKNPLWKSFWSFGESFLWCHSSFTNMRLSTCSWLQFMMNLIFYSISHQKNQGIHLTTCHYKKMNILCTVTSKNVTNAASTEKNGPKVTTCFSWFLNSNWLHHHKWDIKTKFRLGSMFVGWNLWQNSTWRKNIKSSSFHSMKMSTFVSIVVGFRES